jgi:hypothetical protein
MNGYQYTVYSTEIEWNLLMDTNIKLASSMLSLSLYIYYFNFRLVVAYSGIRTTTTTTIYTRFICLILFIFGFAGMMMYSTIDTIALDRKNMKAHKAVDVNLYQSPATKV